MLRLFFWQVLVKTVPLGGLWWCRDWLAGGGELVAEVVEGSACCSFSYWPELGLGWVGEGHRMCP